MPRLTEADLARRARLQEMIDRQDAARGRPLTEREKLDNLYRALAEHDSDCPARKGLDCDCGAADFAH